MTYPGTKTVKKNFLSNFSILFTNLYLSKIMKNLYKSILIILFLSSVVYMSCKESTDTSTGNQTSSCDQNCKDENTAYGVTHLFNFIWNQNIAGQPVGTKDFTVSGPQGGSIHVTGSTAFANNISTCHLIFDMTNSKSSDEHYNLTFTGVVSIDGTFSTNYTALGYTSPALKFQGTVGKNVNAAVDATCAITINETTGHLAGTVCGRNFSYK